MSQVPGLGQVTSYFYSTLFHYFQPREWMTFVRMGPPAEIIGRYLQDLNPVRFQSSNHMDTSRREMCEENSV